LSLLEIWRLAEPTAPVSNFSATPLTGAVPLTVTFSNNSTGATAYEWNFGDGLANTVISPTHVYTQAGVYTVSLTAGDGVVTETLTRSHYLTVTEALAVDFSAFPPQGTAPLLVQFLNNSSGVTAYEWDFGDSITSTQISPTHTYTVAGVYTVTLTAGNELTRTHALTVTEAVVADFSATPLSGTVPLTVTFVNGSVGATGAEWDFGDGSTSTIISPTHIYTTAGVYTVSLTANGSGGRDILTRSSYITVADVFTPQLNVVATYPPSNGLIIPSQSVISVTLNQPIDESTLSATSFTVWGQQSGFYGGSYTVTNRTIEFVSTADFRPGEKVIVGLTDRLQTRDGVRLTPYTWQFQVDVAVGYGTFVDSRQAITSANTVELADVDSDGDLDLFLATDAGNRIWTNSGNGIYVDSLQFVGSDVSLDVALGDLDGDGDLDAFAGNNGEFDRVWFNDGNGLFLDSGQTLGGSYQDTWAVELGDLDGDGDLDAFTGIYNPAAAAQSFSVWINDGFGYFSETPQNWGESTGGYGVTLGDADGDGDLDAFLNVCCGLMVNQLWLNDGTGIFNPGPQTFGDGDAEGSYRGIAQADLDNDGDLDVIAGGEFGNILWLNDGTGYFHQSVQTFNLADGNDIKVGDFDGNGTLDVYMSGYPNGLVWLNDGTAQFSTTERDLGQSGAVAAIGDVDDDGDLDLITTGDQTQIWLNHPRLGVTSHTPTGNGRVVSRDAVIVVNTDDIIDTGTVSTQTFTV
jgi:PKD repeat protein